jgi:hypothetical protein
MDLQMNVIERFQANYERVSNYLKEIKKEDSRSLVFSQGYYLRSELRPNAKGVMLLDQYGRERLSYHASQYIIREQLQLYKKELDYGF